MLDSYPTTYSLQSADQPPDFVEGSAIIDGGDELLQHCLLFSLMTLQASALLILKVARFSAVGCLLNLRSPFSGPLQPFHSLHLTMG